MPRLLRRWLPRWLPSRSLECELMGATISEQRELMRQRSVTLTPDLDAELEERAELEDRSASSIVRIALGRYLTEFETDHELRRGSDG